MTLGIYGAGGTGKAICDEIIRGEKIKEKYEKIIFIDDVLGLKEYYGLEVFSFEEVKKMFGKEKIEFLIALGEPGAREVLFNKIKKEGFCFATWIHPEADVSPSATIGEGCFIDKAYIDNDVIIGKNILVYPQAIIGHNTQIKDHSLISIRAFIGGYCMLEEKVYFGPCAACRDRIHIGENSVIGLNAALYKDVPADYTAIGNPARNLQRNAGKVFAID